MCHTDGVAGSENATGDAQKKLDVLSDDMFVNALYNSSVCAILVSEEQDEPIFVEEKLAGGSSPSCFKAFLTLLFSSSLFLALHTGNFCIAFDPLDGSSNIDCNVSTGTIFSGTS